MEKLHVRLACSDDNHSIQRLIDAHPMQGAISMLLRKAPDYFAATAIRGQSQQSLVGFNDEVLCAMLSRSLQYAYINGEKRILGYLSDLRSDSRCRRKRPLHALGERLRELYAATPACMHIATIIEDNRPAKAALTWANTGSNIPQFADQGKFLTYLLPLLWKRGMGCPTGIVRGHPDMLEDIVAFLNTEGRTKQFYPAYTVEWLQNLPDFQAEDFWVAVEKGTIVGLCAGWDQHRFKQSIIVHYSGTMRLIQRALPALLPAAGSEIRHAYACFFAVKNNNPVWFKKLLMAVHNAWRAKGLRFLLLGLHEQDALNTAVRLFPRLTWPSRLYTADYADTASLRPHLDTRTPYLELATL